MAQRQKAWAMMWRRFLVWFLGNRCMICGSRHKLEFDCITPRGDRHHKMDTSARISFYRAELRKKNIRLACAKCHAAITAEQNRQLELNFELLPF